MGLFNLNLEIIECVRDVMGVKIVVILVCVYRERWIVDIGS